MKLVAVTLAVVVCTQLHAQATATTDPSLAVQKVATSKPVPLPSPVTVTNFPDVQGVEVTNLPAVQTVGGTVSVGNLPLADDGSVRVSSGRNRSINGVLDLRIAKSKSQSTS